MVTMLVNNAIILAKLALLQQIIAKIAPLLISRMEQHVLLANTLATIAIILKIVVNLALMDIIFHLLPAFHVLILVLNVQVQLIVKIVFQDIILMDQNVKNVYTLVLYAQVRQIAQLVILVNI